MSLRRSGGGSAVELLVALPVVLLLGLGVAQMMFVYQARHALEHAVSEAARQGAVEHAREAAILGGLASGLVPWLYGAQDWASLLSAEARAAAHVAEGVAAGWIRVVQRSPTDQSFADWSVPALDAFGEPIAGTVEIPNDNLDSRRVRMQPVSGNAGERDGEPIGLASGQRLADANLLRLELVYGVRLAVPLVGPMIVATLAAWNGCDAADPPTARHRLGLIRLGSADLREDPASDHCVFYAAQAGSGPSGGRIPVRASATIRMMSPARRSDLTRGRADTGSGVLAPAPIARDADPPDLAGVGHDGSGLPGQVSRPGRPADEANRLGNPDIGGAGGRDGQGHGGSPFLGIGSGRPYARPGQHPALCP